MLYNETNQKTLAQTALQANKTTKNNQEDITMAGWFKSQMWKVLEWKDDSTDTVVYRFPMNGKEIMSGSQLTVRESQVGVFVHQGKIADVFGPGQYKLTTKNLPILSGLGALLFQDKESPFKADLYFVNTKQFLDCKWGTSSPVTIRDADFGMIRIRAFGNYAFRVADAQLFLKEVFGTNGLYTVSDIEGYLKDILVGQMTDTIAESKIAALDMAMNLQEFNEMVKSHARAKLAEMGLDITNFNIVNINFPEQVEKAIDERSTLGILEGKMGSYTQKKAADALGDAAKNPGTMGAILGVGLGGAAGGALGATFGAVATARDSEPTAGKKFCPECGGRVEAGAKFCPECGTRLASVCPECGAGVDSSAKFCPECGKKLR